MEHDDKEPWEMSFSEFLNEYNKIMKAVSEKEKKGRLDPSIQPYETVSPEEQELLERDWKAFSRKRGFPEEDIVEYERWLTLSGQRDNLQGAVNDPWRRIRIDYEKNLYLKHVEKALAEGKTIQPETITECAKLKESIGKPYFGFTEGPSTELPTISENQEDVW